MTAVSDADQALKLRFRNVVGGMVLINEAVENLGHQLIRYRDNPEAIEDLANEFLEIAEENDQPLRKILADIILDVDRG